jgi:hypothetical protein
LTGKDTLSSRLLSDCEQERRYGPRIRDYLKDEREAAGQAFVTNESNTVVKHSTLCVKQKHSEIPIGGQPPTHVNPVNETQQSTAGIPDCNHLIITSLGLSDGADQVSIKSEFDVPVNLRILQNEKSLCTPT